MSTKGREGSNKTHNNEMQKGGWYRSDEKGYTTYTMYWCSGRIIINKNHKFLYGKKYHNNSNYWICDWKNPHAHRILVFPTLKAAKERQNWWDYVVTTITDEEE